MESSEQREIELKYRLQDDVLLDTLREDDSFFGLFNLGRGRCQQTVDTYWDTADYALTRGGFGLRTRRQDGRWLVTLKELALPSNSALADRTEVEAPLDEAMLFAFLQEPKLALLMESLAQPGWPPSAWAQVRLRKANPLLRPLAVLQQERHKRMLLPIDELNALALGELSLDTVQIYAPPSCADALPNWIDLAGCAPMATFREIEIEAARADQRGRFQTLATQLSEIPQIFPSTAGKAETALRTLAGIGANGVQGIEPAQSMSEAGRLIWRQQLLEVLLNEAGVRCHQDEDAVHDMRVAIRRIRAAQRIFGPYFDAKDTDPYLRILRKTARMLGAARDLDVAIALLDKYEIALAPVKKVWHKERQLAYAAVQKWLGSKSYSRFISAFGRLCHTPGVSVRAQPAGDLPHGAQVRHLLPAEIFTHYTNMRAYEDAIDAAAPLPILHRLRIEGKRLRYALEFIAHLLDPELAPSLIADLKTLQDRLGNINDAAVMGDRLRRFAKDHPQFSVDRALAQLDTVIEAERASFAPLWAAFVGAETRRRIALAIAHL
ncbi:MAG: CHAD domain-containing protein [Caldilineaceae bacterium]|nr:CHAD domain-containing protein [Caldilineaceae bacterium]